MGMMLIILFINLPDVNGTDINQHPDTSYREIIFENLNISDVSGFDHARPESFLLLFWFYGIAFKIILVATGLIVFCFIFICKGFYRLLRYGVI